MENKITNKLQNNLELRVDNQSCHETKQIQLEVIPWDDETIKTKMDKKNLIQ